MARVRTIIVLTVAIAVAAARADQTPFFGSPVAIPGTIQAQWFDNGGEGIAYHDCDSSNRGGAYRLDEGVDLATGNEGHYYVGWMCAGEWLEYSIVVADATDYLVELRVASERTGGSLRLEFFNPGGEPITRTQPVTVPVTGGWQSWRTVTTTVRLPAGHLQMRLVNTSDDAEFNVNFVRLRPAGATPLRPWYRVGKRAAEAHVNPAQWKLIWSDEFDDPGPVDPAKWKFEVGYQIRNDEAQYYTPGDNAFVEDGNLVIEARRETRRLPDGKTADYTAASLSPTTSWLYGRIEVRAKLPTGRGMWPAIWMLGDRIEQVGWPACGEIDIMENVGYDPLIVHGSVHTAKYNHKIGTQQTSTVQLAAPFENFYVYAVEWFPDRIDFYVDQVKYLTFLNPGADQAAWPFDGPHYLKLNIAVGGMWGAVAGIDERIFPQRFCVDYVRVYRQTGR